MQPPTTLEQPAPTASGAPTQPDSPPSGLATPRFVGELVATHGTGPSRPRGGAPFPVALRIGGTLCPAPCYGETTGAPRQSSLGCCPCGALIYGAASPCQNSQGGGHSSACNWPPNEPHIQPAPEWSPAPATNRSVHWGKADTVPVGYRGENGEGAAEEPCEVHLRWILHYSDIKVRDPVRWSGDHVDGRGWGQAAASQDRGIQVVYAISTVASLLVSTEGLHRRLGV